MKLSINKSAKRVFSLILALAMVIGTLFTATVGTSIVASAETATIEEGTIDTLTFGSYLTEAGSTSTYWDTNVADNGEAGTEDDPIIIDSAEELVYLCKGDSTGYTAGKYFKVADGIKGFDLSKNGDLDYDGTLADNIDKVKASGGKNHAGGTNVPFQGTFDGNGATVYGAWTNHESISGYVGLFSCTKGDVTIKNVNVKLASFTGSSAVGGIVGYHSGDGTNTLTIENCSVTESNLELTGTGYGRSIAGIVGYSANLSSWKEADKGVDGNGDGDMVDTIYVNGICIVNNCFVNIDPTYFIGATDPEVLTDTSVRGTFGGIVGFMTSNGLAVDGCISIGVTPYAVQVYTGGNDVQHSGLESHFTNTYTDQLSGSAVSIGGSSLGARNFTGRVTQLDVADMQGAAAVNNMGLAWFTNWIPGADGEYPTLNQTGAKSDTSFWSGSAASEFAGGTGTKDDPFIIETADQLYRALSLETDTTEGVASSESASVAGGVQSGTMLKQGSTTDYVAVYEPYYYKVADGVKYFYLNSVYGNETLDGIKAFVAANSGLKRWHPAKSFVGHLDGNGVTIYGMYNYSEPGLVYKLDGASTVKNINFDACYATSSSRSALLTTYLGSYSNDTTKISVSNISVRDSYIGTTYVVTATARTDDSGCYDIYGSAAGIIATQNTAEELTISNCIYDGLSCERAIGSGSEITIDMVGGIISGGTSMNNVSLNGCVSLGATIVDEAYVSGKEAHYTRYDANMGYPVYFNDCYTNMPLNEITTVYPGKYDKLAIINRIDTKDVYSKFDMPRLAWANWALTDVTETRTIPMPTINIADAAVGSYVTLIGDDYKTLASVGPYHNSNNPFTYTLKGSGTEEDPYIIETDAQLARAIATGGMNLYDRLYYRLGNDIDLSGGLWIKQGEVRVSGGTQYEYTPFGGSLDGNGHVITGLSAGDTDSTGLIPVLASGGEVKNLHLRNANVISSTYAGAIVGEQQAGSTVTGCSVENSSVESGNANYHIIGSVAGSFSNLYFITADGKCLYVDESSALYGDYASGENVGTLDTFVTSKVKVADSIWYLGGNENSMPRLKNLNSHANTLDVAGDGLGDGYGSADLTALRSKLLKKSAYAYINGDVSRNGKVDLADLAVLQRTVVGNYGEKITDSFFSNVAQGQIKIYYGENDNYDAARKVELYLERLFPSVDVVKCVSASAGTVTGANSNSSQVYLHEGDVAETPDGKLEIIVGNIDNYTAYATNTVATAANTYAVTYDAANKVVWLQGANFTAVEQAAINFVNGSSVDGDVVYTVASTTLEDYKQPITVQLDTDFDGTVDTPTTMYYAWGDEFEEDTINTYNWQHNTHQTEGSTGSTGSFNNLEMAPVKDLGKVLVIEDGRLSMKRAHDSALGGDVTWTTTDGETIVGSVALDVTPGEYNGYQEWSDDANGYVDTIDTDGSDQYLTSGKVTTERGMLYKQGYLEFEGRLPADGHAFPAWWLMGRPAQSATNQGYDTSLYSKIYKLNSNWDGVTDAFVANDLNTYKYQIPSAIYEIDMIEVMQHSDRHYVKKENTGWLASGSYHNTDYQSHRGAVYYYFINSTIHKWWNNGTMRTTDGNLYIQDWDEYTVSSAITNDAFSTTSSEGSWIHNIGSTSTDFGTTTAEGGSWLSKYTYYNTASKNDTAHDELTQTRRYGFSWNTDGSGFEATLYIYDLNGETVTVPIASGMSTLNVFKDKNGDTEANGAIGDAEMADVYSDAKVFNQYMYILFDNKYYSSNENVGDATANMFTDLLQATGLKSFEIEYVRLYQEDGYRDIVTQETQAFNNNNHFGY